jgi:hypothetical protein
MKHVKPLDMTRKFAPIKRNRGIDESSTLLLVVVCFYLQPEHEAQQSAEGQQPAWAAFAVLATPSAITAINNITFNVFIVFSFRSGKSCMWADEAIRVKILVGCRLFLDAEDVSLKKNIST